MLRWQPLDYKLCDFQGREQLFGVSFPQCTGLDSFIGVLVLHICLYIRLVLHVHCLDPIHISSMSCTVVTVVITVVLTVVVVLMVVLLMVAVVHAVAISSSNGNDGSSCNDIMIITKGKA